MNNNIPENVVQLHSASKDGNVSRVQDLLASGLDPNAQDGDGWSPLIWAAEHGREEVVELLLGQPAINLEARSQGGNTALLLAAAQGHLRVATSCGMEEGGPPPITPSLEVDSGLAEEECHHLLLAMPGSQHQRGAAQPVLGVRVHTLGQQGLDAAVVAITARTAELFAI